MVGGLEKFRVAFADFSDNFVIVGGTACDEVLAGTAMRLRPTLDIDIIVIVENKTYILHNGNNKKFRILNHRYVKRANPTRTNVRKVQYYEG